MKSRMGLFLIAVSIFMGTVSFVHAQESENTDVRPYSYENGSYPGEFTNFDGITFFLAETKANGRELWRSDGTEKGTLMVKDIFPGARSSKIKFIREVEDVLYFTADDGAHGRELWRTDGTEQGTFMVKDIFPGEGKSDVKFMGEMDDLAYFSAGDGATGRDLWQSDGSKNGTRKVLDLKEDILMTSPGQSIVIGDTLYFFAFDGVDAYSLWISDGTPLGTIKIKSGFAGNMNDGPQKLTRFKNSVHFFSRERLWKSDGTPEGTMEVFSSDFKTKINSPIVVKNLLYFFGTNEKNHRCFYKSDGTNDGTQLVKILNESSTWVGSSHYLNGGIYFVEHFESPDHKTISRLWKSDGTLNGTIVLKEVGPQGPFISYKGEVYFQGKDEISGAELWKSNGTPEGTFRLKDIFPGKKSAYPIDFILFNNLLYCVASIPNHNSGRNIILRSDGTEKGTYPVTEDTMHYDIRNLFKAGNKMLFNGNGCGSGYELWKIDGTSNGPVLVKDIKKDDITSDTKPDNFSGNGKVSFFEGFDCSHGYELWKSDGTKNGTHRVKDIHEGVLSSYPGKGIFHEGIYYFVADDGIHGRELWKSDGTKEGTVLVKDVLPGQSAGISSTPNREDGKREIGGKATRNKTRDVKFKSLFAGTFPFYFIGNDGQNGWELWRSDGTEKGTFMVKDIRKGPEDSGIHGLFYHNGMLYFAANDGEHGTEVWRSDGTEKGTTLYHDVVPGKNGSFGIGFRSVDENLYLFYGTYDDHSEDFNEYLWSIDTKTDKATFLKEICIDCYTDYVSYITSINKLLVYQFELTGEITPDEIGSEIWVSDGTKEGSIKIFESHSVNAIKSIGNTLFFFTGSNELWRSDGTKKGTTILKKFNLDNGIFYSAPDYSFELNGANYFFMPLFKLSNGKYEYLKWTLWKTDGTPNGTQQIAAFESNDKYAFIYPISFDNTLYFPIKQLNPNQIELWKSDGTNQGSVMIKRFDSIKENTTLNDMINTDGTLTFTINQIDTGEEIWRSDGTQGGTYRLTGEELNSIK